MTIQDFYTAENIGETARRLRKEKGLSVNDAAEMCGVSRQTIYNFENNLFTSYELLVKYMRLIVFEHSGGEAEK